MMKERKKKKLVRFDGRESAEAVALVKLLQLPISTSGVRAVSAASEGARPSLYACARSREHSDVNQRRDSIFVSL